MIGTSWKRKNDIWSKAWLVFWIFPFIEMDAVFWGPDWGFPPDEEFFSRLSDLLEGEKWVLDGNYTRTMEFKWDRVQAVVWLNFSFARTVYQAIKRAS